MADQVVVKQSSGAEYLIVGMGLAGLAFFVYWMLTQKTGPLSCDIIAIESDCVANGCFWYNGSCHTSKVCSDIINPADCLEHQCFWYNSSCHSEEPTECGTIENQTECVDFGCYWYDGSCHGVPPNPVISQVIVSSFNFSTENNSSINCIIDTVLVFSSEGTSLAEDIQSFFDIVYGLSKTAGGADIMVAWDLSLAETLTLDFNQIDTVYALNIS